jgi:hypothetical protein
MRKSNQTPSLLDPPARPTCACGKPAEHEVALTVKTLELQNRYWTASYQTVTTEIRSMICSDCLSKNIIIQFTAKATMTQAKKASSGNPIT